MPLPWKKAKIDRVTRFVADLRSSKRADSSLVVQTGFPTSLIDLIVKNRDRLKKPSRKKKKQSNHNHNRHHHHNNSKSSSSDDDDDSCCVVPSDSFNSTTPNVDAAIGDNDVCCLNVVNEVDDEVEEVSVVRNGRAFVIILKLFLLLILAFGTKKLAFGVTASAFLLLFLEFTGKRLICLFRPCADARKCLNSFVENILVSFRLKKQKCLNLSELESDALLVEEIEVIESDLDFRDSERRCEGGELDDEKEMISLKDEYIIEEIEEEEEIVVSPKKISSAKLKAKLLKKVILKKIRGSKSKRNKDYIELDRSCVTPNCEDREEKLIAGEEKKVEQVLLEEDELEGEDEEHRSTDDVSQLCCNGEAIDNVGRIASWNSVHLIPFVIVLTGLLGGRTMALALTMAWCALVKLVQLRRIRR